MQGPKVTVSVGTAEVAWTTGPNKSSYEYTVSCYRQDMTIPTNDCQAVASSGLAPIARVTGSLPLEYASVVVDFTDLPSEIF